jgi:hypothetical protein
MPDQDLQRAAEWTIFWPGLSFPAVSSHELTKFALAQPRGMP